MHRLVGFTHDDGVDERRERKRIAEGQRSACQDERVLLASVLGERRDACQLQALNQAGQLGLIGHRNRDDRVVGDRSQLLIGHQRGA